MYFSPRGYRSSPERCFEKPRAGSNRSLDASTNSSRGVNAGQSVWGPTVHGGLSTRTTRRCSRASSTYCSTTTQDRSQGNGINDSTTRRNGTDQSDIHRSIIIRMRSDSVNTTKSKLRHLRRYGETVFDLWNVLWRLNNPRVSYS
jgi:hypothetical protein